VRAQTAALVDGRLLLDCGPEVPYAASRLGRSLAGVRHLLLTHSHPDHAGPMALLARHWAHRGEMLDLVGPQQALDVFADWVGPDDPVRPVAVAAGDRLQLGDFEIAVLEAAHGDEFVGPGVLYDVTSGDGGRLLYATDTGPLPASTLAAVAGRGYDVVLLEQTFGELLTHTPGHLDLVTFAQTVRQLRDNGAVTEDTDVVAIHLGHHDPSPERLSQRLAPVGARVVADGTVLGTGRGHDHGDGDGRDRDRLTAPVRTLVLGGARSGKSAYSEQLALRSSGEVTYLATGVGGDDDAEWQARIALHRSRRPANWSTQETTDVATVLRKAAAGSTVLVDCLSLWITAVLTGCGAWEAADPATQDEALRAVTAAVDDLVEAWRSCPAEVIAVSNEVGSGVVPATPSGRLFRDELGRLNARIAAVSDTVVLVVAGVPLHLKAGDPAAAHPPGV